MSPPMRSTLARLPALAGSGLLAGTLLLLSGALGAAPAPMTATRPPRVSVFDLDELRARRAGEGRAYLEFLAEPSLRMGLYHLPAGGTDGQSPHGQDEIYYVASGSGILEAGGVEHPAGPGSVFYVRAEVPHRFHSITEDLDVLVVFSTAAPSEDDPAERGFAADAVTSAAATAGMGGSALLEVSTLEVGVERWEGTTAMQTPPHDVDEINLVLAGSGTVDAGGEISPVGPMSVVYVERGAQHAFRPAGAGLDLLRVRSR